MRATVENILNGKLDYDRGGLDFSVSRIELALFPGQEHIGSFYVYGEPRHVTEGRIYTSDLRLKIFNESFSGTQSEIGFSYSTEGLEEGDVCESEIYVVSNQGEYYIPVTATITHGSMDSSMGGIKNLFHFTNLAKSNWEEAVRLFYSKEFISLFTGNDAQFKKVYYGLSHYYDNEQNVEEFLLAINKKQPIEYIPEREVITLDNPEGIVEEYINISRNGWGYTVLEAKTDSDFISFEKNHITDNDFLGNYLSFPVRINPDNLHGGTNYGKITLYNTFTSFDIKVVVNMDVVTKNELSKHLELQRAQYDMLTFYEAFRNHKIDLDAWIAETTRVVDRMLALDDKDLSARLFKAQLLMTEERYNEAKWILDQAEAEFQSIQDFSSAGWAYYLYLTTLYSKEENYIDEITKEVWNLYRNNQTEWRMAWLLLYLSEEFAVSPSKKWIFIEETMEKGCLSPMFYVEAINMLNANPGLLTKLSSFELNVIRYGLNNELLSEDIISQLVYLASKEREYTEGLYCILNQCYAIAPSKELATVICELLIKGDKRDERAFNWYLLAIEEELRVTRVYEYYMESLDLSKDISIPKMVYLYFSYENNLDYESAAYLYARVISARDEMPDVFDNYRASIERFSSEQILAGHINKDLAVIYRFVLDDINVSVEMAEMLSKLLFVHKVTIANPMLTKAIVYQNRESIEEVYPVQNGVAYVPVYNKDYTLLFEDGISNRYTKSIEYTIEKLMVPGKLSAMILPLVTNNLGFDVYACECSSEMVVINDETKERYRRILNAPSIDADYKSMVRAKLLQYYYDNDEIRDLDDILDELEASMLTKRERIHAIRFMLIRGMYDKALEWLVNYGIEDVDPKDILKLATKLITRGEYEYKDELLKMCVYAFNKGKYDEVMLRYIVANYQGMTRDLRKFFNASKDFDVEIYSLCEHMLMQMLYTGYFVSERMEIYRKYVQAGAGTDIQMAFLTQCAYDYFVKEHLMESFIFEELTKCKLRGEYIQTVCKLAYLKFYSESEGPVGEVILEIIKEYLNDLLSEGIYMSFFKNYMESTTASVNKFSDKTIVEYKTEPGKRVFIHYIIEGDGEISGEYTTEEMHDMYGGVHAKAFILFFGENLLYYITEESDGKEVLTESNSIQKSDISRDIYDSRFNEVNDIVIAKTLQDYDTVNKLLYDYKKHNYMVKQLFTLQ